MATTALYSPQYTITVRNGDEKVTMESLLLAGHSFENPLGHPRRTVCRK
jgi:hypothetical protein